jgi:hypothetical protein
MAGRGSPLPLPAPSTQLAPGSWCEVDGWCWYNPLPSGNFLNAVAGAGRTDLWIGGEAGLSVPGSNVLHFDGGRWSIEPSPLGLVYGIWAASENDVWFVGDDVSFQRMGAIARWDGGAITVVASFPGRVVTSVWGAGPNDVYAVAGAYGGGDEIALHWDGGAWSQIPGVGGTHVAGSGPSDVWIGASDGLLHFDGASWSRVPALEGQRITALTVAAPGDVWLVRLSANNIDQFVEHLDASGLTLSFQLANTGEGLASISASSPRDIWLVGNVFTAEGNDGYLNHYDGQRWERAPSSPTSLNSVAHVPGFGDIAVGASGGIVRLTTTPALGFIDLRSGTDRDLTGTFGSSPTDMWAVGLAGTVLHYDGQMVAVVPAGTSVNLTDVWGTGPGDVWAVGEAGTVLHHDGSGFAPVASGTTANLRAVFTARPGDVWIGGDGPTLLHWDGSSMTPVALPGAEAGAAVLDLHGIAADEIWLSGGGFSGGMSLGFVSHFDGTAWSPVERLTFSIMSISQSVLRIWQLAPDDVWMTVGQLSLRGGGPDAYMHFDGSTWTELLQDPTTLPPPVPPVVFPNRYRPSFIFGPHDRWRADLFGTWQRNTN